jgi:hypothetical protein
VRLPSHRDLLLKSQQKTDEMIENMIDTSNRAVHRNPKSQKYSPMNNDDEAMSEMTEIQMFGGDTRRSGNSSAFKNPYMDGANTSGISSSLYAGNVRYNQGIKSYEQAMGPNDGGKDEPMDKYLPTITEASGKTGKSQEPGYLTHTQTFALKSYGPKVVNKNVQSKAVFKRNEPKGFGGGSASLRSYEKSTLSNSGSMPKRLG